MKQRFTEHEFEVFLGNLLRYGVILAATVVTIGGIFYLINHGTEAVHYHHFRGEPQDFRAFGSIIHDAFTLKEWRSVIQLGLLILLAVPVLRVAFSAYGFARQSDRTYVIITLVVLAVLLWSLFNPV